jgi:hypothetical protein
MKTTNKMIHGEWWHITLLQEPEDVDDAIIKYHLQANWATFLKERFGGRRPKNLGICFFAAKWIIVVNSATRGATLAHELGHAWAFLKNGDKSEAGAHRAAKLFLAPYKRFYRTKEEYEVDCH